MKIIQAGNYPTDHLLIRGGIQASVYGLTQELIKNHEVVVISSPQKGIEQDYFIRNSPCLTIYYLKNRFRFNLLTFLCLPKFIKLLNKEKADVVHIHESSLCSLFLIIYLLSKKKKFILTEHGILHVELWKNFKRDKSLITLFKVIPYFLIEFFCLNLSRRIIVDTLYVQQYLKKITFRKLHVIPQGINDIFYTLQDQPDSMNLLSIGSISPRKGHEYSIEAIHIVKQQFPEIRYKIIGIIESDNIPYLRFLEDKITKLGLEKNVDIETDVSFDRILLSIEKSNVFILHSLEESQGIVFCEAMAAGKPIVATNVGGIPCVVNDKCNGKLSKVGDTDTFANHIISILKDRDIRNAMSKQSRTLSLNYTWDSVVGKIVDLYS